MHTEKTRIDAETNRCITNIFACAHSPQRFFEQEMTMYTKEQKTAHAERNPIRDSLGLHLLSCGEMKSADTQLTKRQEECYRICFVLSGSGYLMSGESKYAVQDRTAFLLRPGRDMQYQDDPLFPTSYVWLDLEGSACESIMNRVGFSDNTAALALDKTIMYMARTTVENVKNCKEERPGDELRAAGIVLELLSCMEQVVSEKEEKKASGNLALSGKALHLKRVQYVEYMERYFRIHMGEKIRMNELAAELGIVPYYMSQVYKSVRGITPSRYLTDLRIATGKQLLENTDDPIKDIALRCGYDNQLNFSKVFRKNVGCSPRDYRKKIRETLI